MRATELYERIAELTHQGTPFVLATIVSAEGSSPRKPGTKMVVLQDGSTVETIGGGALELEVVRDALDALRRGTSAVKHYELRPTGEHALGMLCGGETTVFLEVHAPDKTLLIIGAGHIAQKLCPMAKLLDFRVVVFDSREDMVSPQRFPGADQLICAHPGEAAERFPIDEATYVVIASHTHVHDKDALRSVVTAPAAYVGMMASRRKAATIVEELTGEGVDPGSLARVRTPIGLAIGGQTPAELSVSILSEIIAHDHGKLGALASPPSEGRPAGGCCC